MTCEHARALIDGFVLDELSPAQARTLADHVRGCVACTAEGNVGKRREPRDRLAPSGAVI